VQDLFSRHVVGWSMNAEMTAQLVTDMAIWRRGKPDALLHHSDRGSQGELKWWSQRWHHLLDEPLRQPLGQRGDFNRCTSLASKPPKRLRQV
jgi:transposase InsO family protein